MEKTIMKACPPVRVECGNVASMERCIGDVAAWLDYMITKHGPDANLSFFEDTWEIYRPPTESDLAAWAINRSEDERVRREYRYSQYLELKMEFEPEMGGKTNENAS